MKDEMIHSYLDGEMSDIEQQAFMEEVNADKSLKQNLTSLQKIVWDAQNLPKINVSGNFTDSVMVKVESKSEKKTSGIQRMVEFLFQRHNLRWNVVSAAALVLVTVAVTVIVTLGVSRGTPSTPGGVVVKINEPPTDAALPITSGRAGSVDSDSQSSLQAQTAFVKLFLYMPDAKEISLCGDFNDWKPNEIKLKKAENSALWTVTIPLSINKTYQYMFVVDGRKWMADPMDTASFDDGFGNKNSVLDLRNMW